MLFSQAFNIGKSQPELDFVDIDVDLDFPLYFDPSTFLDGDDEFSKDCADDIYDFFDAVMEAIRQGDRHRGVELLAALREPNDTHLGVSKGKPAGRGLGPGQAAKVYRSLAGSKAIGTSLITDLSDYAMFIDGIGPDKISDITTNIIRERLLTYTIEQCDLNGVQLHPSLPSGLVWDRKNRKWKQKYVDRPYYDDAPILLVPKRYVKWQGAVSKRTRSYYKSFVRNFIKEEQLRTNGPLVSVIKRGKREEKVVLLGDIEKKYPGTKKFLVEFSSKHPNEYEKFKKTVIKHNPVADAAIFEERDEEFFDPEFAEGLIGALKAVPAGKRHASDYHRLIVGILQFLFYPALTAPRIETPINERRKLIDITYVNAADVGFFRRLRDDSDIKARWVMVECKNYFDDPKNPEFDQLAMRFSNLRGQFGLLLHRSSKDRQAILARCKDIAQAGKGFVVAVDDDDIIYMLGEIAAHRRSNVSRLIETRFSELLS